ncbi:HAD hydrolase family protein [Candidatus Bathyarchaeota archaeon]|nr:HAD hydrolase family protein [Candidatus Bathyarchaeota archaeon]
MKGAKLTAKKIFISDCEGPLSTNDNAFEVTSHFIKNGDNLFALISKCDDVLADVIKRPDYKAGNTLKFVLPFLKAYNVTDKELRDFSRRTVRLVPNAKDTLRFIRSIMHAFIVNTGYEHYTLALCDHLDFPYDKAYGTKLELDKYRIDESEKKELRKIKEEIVSMPMITIPKNAKSVDDFAGQDKDILRRLDKIFCDIIPKMGSGKILNEIDPRGGWKKAETVKDIVEELNGSFTDTVYIGDSITDAECLELIRGNDGLAISFNGNEYAIRKAEIAIQSENTVVTSILMHFFCKFGKEYVLKLAENWDSSTLSECVADKTLQSKLVKMYSKSSPAQVEIVNSRNIDRLIKESCTFRKKVRGEAIGKLG